MPFLVSRFRILRYSLRNTISYWGRYFPYKDWTFFRSKIFFWFSFFLSFNEMFLPVFIILTAENLSIPEGSSPRFIQGTLSLTCPSGVNPYDTLTPWGIGLINHLLIEVLPKSFRKMLGYNDSIPISRTRDYRGRIFHSGLSKYVNIPAIASKRSLWDSNWISGAEKSRWYRLCWPRKIYSIWCEVFTSPFTSWSWRYSRMPTFR